MPQWLKIILDCWLCSDKHVETKILSLLPYIKAYCRHYDDDRKFNVLSTWLSNPSKPQKVFTDLIVLSDPESSEPSPSLVTSLHSSLQVPWPQLLINRINFFTEIFPLGVTLQVIFSTYLYKISSIENKL